MRSKRARAWRGLTRPLKRRNNRKPAKARISRFAGRFDPFQVQILFIYSSARGLPSFAKTFTAKYRTSLCRTKRHRCFLAALRADCVGFNFGPRGKALAHRRSAHRGKPLGLAILATFGFVLELFVVEK